jgi:hypothetical protein
MAQDIAPQQGAPGADGQPLGFFGESVVKDEDFLGNIALTAREWRAVGELSRAYGEFEPVELRDHVGPVALARLIEMGVAERGPTPARFDRRAYPVGYRLSPLGWKVMKRGRAPQR